jgi:hypothetical protein
VQAGVILDGRFIIFINSPNRRFSTVSYVFPNSRPKIAAKLTISLFAATFLREAFRAFRGLPGGQTRQENKIKNELKNRPTLSNWSKTSENLRKNRLTPQRVHPEHVSPNLEFKNKSGAKKINIFRRFPAQKTLNPRRKRRGRYFI